MPGFEPNTRNLTNFSNGADVLEWPEGRPEVLVLSPVVHLKLDLRLPRTLHVHAPRTDRLVNVRAKLGFRKTGPHVAGADDTLWL
jgi:hypothetical protein